MNFRLLLPAMLQLLSFQQLLSQTPDNKDSLKNLEMFQVIRKGDDAGLTRLLNSGANPNAVMNGYSALMAATLNGTPTAMTTLIEKGANVNYCNADSISAIWLAVPDKKKTSLLISHNANVEQHSREGNTVIVKLAGLPGNADLLPLLVKAGSDIRHCSKANDGLYNAAASGDTAMLGYFIRAAVPVNDTNCYGDYPINAALNFRSVAALKMLVEHGADVNPKQVSSILPLLAGITPLMWSAVSNDKASFLYLLEHGANAKAVSAGGYNALVFLARSAADEPEMTKALLDRGVDPTAKALDDTDALYHFTQRGNTRSVELLNKQIDKNKSRKQ